MFKTVVLVADNEQASLATTSEALKDAGYATIEADSLTEARRKLQERRMAVAVLDVRLEDDDNEKDFSGVNLARTIAPEIPKVLYAAFPNQEDVIRLATSPQGNGQSPVASIVSKREGPDALIAAVSTALRQRTRRASEWLRAMAVVLLPVGFGFGVMAMVMNDPKWLFGTVVMAALAVGLMGASIIRSQER